MHLKPVYMQRKNRKIQKYSVYIKICKIKLFISDLFTIIYTFSLSSYFLDGF